MSIVFFGTGVFAVPILKAVSGHVSLVVTQPDRKSGRGMKEQPSPVKITALELDLPLEAPEKSRAPEFVEKVASLEPDILLVASYGQILSERLLAAAKHGGINLHGSILPKLRGAAPIQRALLNGETETGVTLMQMGKGMDTGDIIEIRKTTIGPDETYGELQDRLAILAAEQAMHWIKRLMAGDYPRIQQNHELATYAAKVEKQEAALDFHGEAKTEYNRFRAFTPAPGAYLVTKFGRIRLSQARFSRQECDPGTVYMPNLVAFKGGCLELVEVQPEGKRRMAGKDFFNGYRLRNGEKLV